MRRGEWRWVAGAVVVLVVVSSLPYAIAWATTPEGAGFTGLVFNPQDGHSYLAKMRQGLEGSWRFQLTYTPERSPGAPVYLYHLWLGHVARWTGLPLIGVYHGARILGGVAMLMGIYALACQLSDRRRERGTMFLLTALGSGVGWLAGVVGVQTADLWVAEAFPAYSLMGNAHFPLAIGLMTAIGVGGLRVAELTRSTENHQATVWPWGIGMTVAAVLLGGIQPFGLVPVFGGLGVMVVARAVREGSIPRRAGAWVAAAGAAALPYPVYMQLAIRADPVLAAWNAQNATSSPPLWDWALSYGLVLVLAVLGGRAALRRGSDGDWLLVGWILVTVIGMVVPHPLQRRLSLGLGVPVGLLAGVGWWRGARAKIQPRRRGLWRGLAIGLSALTPVFLMAMVSLAALAGEPWFYLSDGEWAALRWLRDEGRPEVVVLCAPQTGTFVPSWAGQRVVYGHPFETLDAERRRAEVEAVWGGEMSAAEEERFLEENQVRYVMLGPRERALGAGVERSGEFGVLVFETEDVKVYDVSGQ
ncbi:MAG: hypothetical protein U9R72_00655 [Chloroflexota bacterium]|nr:hypothetical protein [Chloroflexota bacterium]